MGHGPRSTCLRVALAAYVFGSLHACRALPGETAIDPVELLERARLALAAERPADALLTLEAIEFEALPRDARPRFVYTLGLTHFQLGDPYQAFLDLVDFANDYPLAEERINVQALIFASGRELARSAAYIPVFVDQQRDGEVILEHLITHYPNSPDRDDALQILGEIAYSRGDYDLSSRRYEELIRDYRDSEWTDLARFRVAMTRFLRLRGPGYDLAAMGQARRELEVLLEAPPDRQDFVDEASETLRTVDDWIAQHHVLTANYYRTLDNPRGEVLYLRKACEAPREHTDAGKEALRRLAALEGSLPADPAAAVPAPTETGGGL